MSTCLLIMLDTLLLRSSPHFTTLHHNSPQSTQIHLSRTENFVLSTCLLIMLDTLLLRSSLHFTTLHHNSPHFTTIHHTSPQFTTIHPNTLIEDGKFRIIYMSFNNVGHLITKIITTLHHISPHFTTLHHTSQHFTTLHPTTLIEDGKNPSVKLEIRPILSHPIPQWKWKASLFELPCPGLLRNDNFSLIWLLLVLFPGRSLTAN